MPTISNLFKAVNVEAYNSYQDFSGILKGLINANAVLSEATVTHSTKDKRSVYTDFTKFTLRLKPVLAKLLDMGLSLVQTQDKTTFTDKQALSGIGSNMMFFSPDSFVSLYFQSTSDSNVAKAHIGQDNRTVFIECVSTDVALHALVKKLVEDGEYHNLVPRPVPGSVHVLTIDTHKNLQLQELGRQRAPFMPTNYTEKVVEDYNFILEEIKRKTPDGRLVVAAGVPGTGKTNLIKSIVSNVTDKDCLPILIPTHMLENLQDPSFMTLLLRYTGKRMVLILEDADRILAPRKILDEAGKEVRNSTVDISALSAILNLTDGFYGQMLDLYVIATTNADNVHLDPAVLRPGRLSRKVDVNALSMERAMVCYHAIMGTKSKDGTHFDKPTTLAEVYALCREHGWSVDDVPEELTGGSVTNEEAYEDDSEYY